MVVPSGYERHEISGYTNGIVYCARTATLSERHLDGKVVPAYDLPCPVVI